MLFRFVFAAALIALVSCEKQTSKTLFSRLSPSDTGIEFNNVNVENEDYNVLVYEYFYNGGGVAVGDINNDGLVDVYLSSNQRENKLYLNKGDFQFEDITARSGTGAKNGWKTGVAMVDINADGLLDIYVCRSAANEPEQRRNSLFINKGDLTFEDRAKDYGLDDDSYSTHSAFLDYDQDGDLDMFLLNHAVSRIVRNYDIRTESKTDRIPFVGNRLFENRNGKFVDVSDSVGVYGPAHNFGLGVCYSDLNGDGFLDIYTSNDYTGSDKLLLNENGKHFREAEQELLTHISRFSMGTDIADVNNDGLPDIYSLDMLPDNNKRQKELIWADNYDIYFEMVKNGLHHQTMRNMLHLNNGFGAFSEVGQVAGVSNTDWSWSALFGDYDNDGLQDLFVSNGYKRDYTNNDFVKYRADQMAAKEYGRQSDSYSKMIAKMPSTKTHNYLFKNLDGYQFRDVSSDWGMGDLTLSHGAASADLDNDGDLDLVINNMDETAGIYRNNAEANGSKFLKVKLVGEEGNIFGLGAKVKVYKDGKMMLREMCPYRGFQSSIDPTLHFGLGSILSVDSVVVQWPGGKTETGTSIASNQTLTFQQKDAVARSQSDVPVNTTVFSESSDLLSFTHKENPFIDFKYQPLLTRMYSTQGPAMASADVNGDGLDDLYIGGAKDQAGQLFINGTNGKYTPKANAAFLKDAAHEDVDAIFLDIDNDRDQDLYVVSGGYEFNIGDPLFADRIYRNDGRGNFAKVPSPPILVSKSCARPDDIDNDGDLDIFLGGRITPGRYPEIPESHIIMNDGKGNYTAATELVAPELKDLGMVTDAQWIDLNHDDRKDLVIVGEWMPIKAFINRDGKLTDESLRYFPGKTNGFWTTILAHDFDNDGDSDMIIGNLGLNNQIKATESKPASLLYGDFDSNGSVDPLLSYYVQDVSYPFPTRDELTEHLPMMKKKFRDYRSYALATIDSVLSPQQIGYARKLMAFRCETTYFRNDNDTFTTASLPIQMQYAPIFAMSLMDINRDGIKDLATGGNLTAARARTGMLKGNHAFIFLGHADGTFSFLPPHVTGINLTGDVREIIADGDKLIFAMNNEHARVFRITNSAALVRTGGSPSLIVKK